MIINYNDNLSISIPDDVHSEWLTECGNNCVFIKDSYLSKLPNKYETKKGYNTIWEYETVNYFINLMKNIENPVIVDVGAQMGLYTLTAKFLPESSWHSFELFNNSFKLLNKNIEHNKLTNVKTYNIGLSNSQGESFLYVPKKDQGRGGLNTMGTKEGRVNQNLCDKVKIKIDTLDNILRNTKVDMIKIDVEGWELNVLLGAKNILNTYKPKILLEYMENNAAQCGIKLSELDKFLKKYNYNLAYSDNMGERMYV